MTLEAEGKGNHRKVSRGIRFTLGFRVSEQVKNPVSGNTTEPREVRALKYFLTLLHILMVNHLVIFPC
jgi:hypothetical protein